MSRKFFGHHREKPARKCVKIRYFWHVSRVFSLSDLTILTFFLFHCFHSFWKTPPDQAVNLLLRDRIPHSFYLRLQLLFFRVECDLQLPHNYTHRFSIRFRSGLLAGQAMTVTPLPSNHAVVAFAECAFAPSCIKLFLSNSFFGKPSFATFLHTTQK